MLEKISYLFSLSYVTQNTIALDFHHYTFEDVTLSFKKTWVVFSAMFLLFIAKIIKKLSK